MTRPAPPLGIEIPPPGSDPVLSADDVTNILVGKLEASSWHWTGRPAGEEAGDAAWSLVRLFGRLTELIFKRLNQVPEKHFLAFLNEAGVDLLPPRAARVDLVFKPKDGGPAAIHVPAGTQVATAQTETQGEMIFETQRDVVLAPNMLDRCIAVDPLCLSERAPDGSEGAFPAFRGALERELLLCLGDPEMFSFSDDASRLATTVTLKFVLESPDSTGSDDWQLAWRYWDGERWADLPKDDDKIIDYTQNFAQDGQVKFSGLPPLPPAELHGLEGPWIACALTGGTARDHLPVFEGIECSRETSFTQETIAADVAGWCAFQGTSGFVPLDLAGDFFPLGMRPGRLDTCYLCSTEAFSKPGATVTIELARLAGVPKNDGGPDLTDLKVVWEYYSVQGWKQLGVSMRGGTTQSSLSFEDTTKAFTITTDPSTRATITLTVPGPGPDDPQFAETTVNEKRGCWVRARLLEGSYNEVVETSTAGGTKYAEMRTHAPQAGGLTISYVGSTTTLEARPVKHLAALVDAEWVVNPLPDDPIPPPFDPFVSRPAAPALYLGFRRAFPAGEWLQLLMDVDQTISAGERNGLASVVWEYWNGGWTPLAASDGSHGLAERGYLGFFGPEDHRNKQFFDHDACWLRARLAQPPEAEAGAAQHVMTDGESATVELDASGSRAYHGMRIARYSWSEVTSQVAIAAAGPPRRVIVEGDSARVTLDASQSRASQGATLRAYHWRKLAAAPTVSPAAEELPEAAGEMPTIKAIRMNTAPALNVLTLRDEVLGSSNAAASQSYTLSRRPVLPDAAILVREPDRPPEDELAALQADLSGAGAEGESLVAAAADGTWVRWCQVTDFHSSGPASRHFTLDPISGQVRFGDGERGRIPPPGRNNVKAALYRTHNAWLGNVAAGAIATLRNPTGALADVVAVTNPEPAAGGSDGETIAEVRVRGPQSLKHRQRGVTAEDFVWLAREASGEVARAWCLPARNALGLSEPGWVTVVIIPQSSALRPAANPALLRHVREYLQDHALGNLKEAARIHVTGASFVETRVIASVVPVDPVQADTVQLALLRRLEAFLSPLHGGPARQGWDLGRDVYLSEIYAEIEATPGVDHVAEAHLAGSLQQYRLQLRAENGVYRRAPFDLPLAAQVGTFDKRTTLLLANPIRKDEPLAELLVYGFNAGDRVAIVRADNSVVLDGLELAALDGDWASFAVPFEQPAGWAERDALLSADGRLRLPLQGDVQAQGDKVQALAYAALAAGDKVSLVAGTRRDPVLEFLSIELVELCRDRIVIPAGHLPCSGKHDIEMVVG